MTLLEYIAQQRVAYAQRLLATTNLKIIDVAMDSGIGSVCRFHAYLPCCAEPRRANTGHACAGIVPPPMPDDSASMHTPSKLSWHQAS